MQLHFVIVTFGELADDETAADITGAYSSWVAELGADTVAVRLDFCVHGATDDYRVNSPNSSARLDVAEPHSSALAATP